MGLLDDAIREHLDLKRRRGADPTEIERAEREALGPVRRGPELAEEEAAAPESVESAEPDYGHEPDFAHEPDFPQPASEQLQPFEEDAELREFEEPEDLPPYEHPHAPAGDPLMDDEAVSGQTHEAEPPDFGRVPEAEPRPHESAPLPPPHPADPPSAADPRERRSTHIDQETEEYELEPEDEARDDVLESTPEFLQDAPEHDRLWFEQRPPRDFDFDG